MPKPTKAKASPATRAKRAATARAVLGLLGQVDWPRAFQRAGVLMRTLRGEASEQIEADGNETARRGQQLYRTVQGAARQAVGCRAPQQKCDCIVCVPENWKEGR